MQKWTGAKTDCQTLNLLDGINKRIGEMTVAVHQGAFQSKLQYEDGEYSETSSLFAKPKILEAQKNSTLW